MVTVVVGNNDLLVQQTARERIAAFGKEYGDTAVERYDGADTEPVQLQNILQAVPFLSAKRLVVLRGASSHKAIAEALPELLSDVPETTEVLIIEQNPDKRTAYYKFLMKQSDVLRCDELDVRGLTDWLVAEAERRGGQLRTPDAQYLVDRVGTNQLQLAGELDKLLTYDPHVSRHTIELLTDRSPQSSVFELLDAAFAGRTERALALFKEQRAQAVEPMAIVGMIAWQLHILAVVKAAGSRSPEEIAKDAKLSPFVVKKALGLVRSIPLTTIKQWVRSTLQLDAELKRKPINADDAVQHLLLSFAALKK